MLAFALSSFSSKILPTSTKSFQVTSDLHIFLLFFPCKSKYEKYFLPDKPGYA